MALLPPKRQCKKRPKPASTYPGTPSPPDPIGPCASAHCGRVMVRGDLIFGDLDTGIFCIDCWEKQPGVDLAAAEPIVVRARWMGGFPQ